MRDMVKFLSLEFFTFFFIIFAALADDNEQASFEKREAFLKRRIKNEKADDRLNTLKGAEAVVRELRKKQRSIPSQAEMFKGATIEALDYLGRSEAYYRKHFVASSENPNGISETELLINYGGRTVRADGVKVEYVDKVDENYRPYITVLEDQFDGIYEDRSAGAAEPRMRQQHKAGRPKSMLLPMPPYYTINLKTVDGLKEVLIIVTPDGVVSKDSSHVINDQSFIGKSNGPSAMEVLGMDERESEVFTSFLKNKLTLKGDQIKTLKDLAFANEVLREHREIQELKSSVEPQKRNRSGGDLCGPKLRRKP